MAEKMIIVSTEPQARKVLKQIEKARAKPKQRKDTGGKTTAKSPPSIKKSKAEGRKEKAEARKRIAAKIAEAKRNG